jgi:peroxiredoxin
MRHRASWLAVCIALIGSTCFAGEYNLALNIGDKSPAWFDLPGIDGHKHSLAGMSKYDVVVVVFTCNSCLFAIDYEDRLVAFAKQHAAGKKVALVGINVNKVPADSLDNMKKRATKKGFTFPYLYDGSQQIAKDYGATYTPEFFVLDKNRKIVYMGAMDDNSEANKVTKRYVDDAVAAALQGKLPAVKETVAVGCTVRYKRQRRK